MHAKLTPREGRKAGTTRNIAMKYLFLILAAWMASGFMVSPTAGVAAGALTVGMTSDECFVVKKITTAALPNRHGSGDELVVLEPRDAVDSDTVVPKTLTDSLTFSLVGESLYHRIAVYERLHPLRTVSNVEPRFLRYARLLN